MIEGNQTGPEIKKKNMEEMLQHLVMCPIYTDLISCTILDESKSN